MSKDKDIEKKGRRGALESLRKAMRGMEGEGIKKVTVAAEDTEGLKEGLDVAKEKLEEMKEVSEDHEDHDHSEDDSEKKSDLDDKSREELIEMINDLK